MAAPVHRFSPLDQGDEADTTEYHPDIHHLPSTDRNLFVLDLKFCFYYLKL